MTRRAAKQVPAGRPAIISSVASSNNGPWVGTKGFNSMWPYLGPTLNEAGTAFANNPFNNPRTFEERLPQDKLKYLRDVGFDFVRLNVATNPWHEAIDLNQTERVTELLDILNVGVQAYLRAGIHVMLDLHPAYYGPISYWPGIILQSAVDSKQRSDYKKVVQAFANYFKVRSNSNSLMLELFNEPPHPSAITGSWYTWQQELWSAARAIMPHHCIGVTCTDFSSIDRLSELSVTSFDDRTRYVVHPYRPALFTIQGYPASSYNKYVYGLKWPPGRDGQTKASVIAFMEANVDADNSLSAPQKAAIKASQSIEIGYYFDVPLNKDWLVWDLQKVTDWATVQGIPINYLLANEYGVTRTNNGYAGANNGFIGADQTSRELYIKDSTEALDSIGVVRATFAIDAIDYGLSVLSDQNFGRFSPTMLDALDL